ncbi:MAG: antitermination protein NusG [Candidatus Nealsonbacteria bacterium]|nr:antitermination protein NusG [Candidatus Nealsonbacteria bacterium]
MPILAAETSIFPENLFELSQAEPSDSSWLAVYTMARQEKALARQLLARETPFYLPLVAKDSSSSRGRRVRSFVPLFNGYIFLFGTEQDRVGALTTNRISRILPVKDQQQLCQDLMQVYHLIKTDAPLTIERRLMPGRRVRVKAGAMMGMEGTVTSRRGPCRLLVAINFLQQGVSVAIDDYMLEPLD